MASTATYCTITDIQNRLSATGVTLRTDDTPPTSYGDVIDDASAEIEMYCLLRYGADQLAATRWIRHKCADIATYLLCERRGNAAPPGVAGKFDRAIADLQKIQAGSLKLADVPQRRRGVPTVSNMRPAMRPFPHAVVETKRGTEVVEQLPQKNKDPWDGMNVLPDVVI